MPKEVVRNDPKEAFQRTFLSILDQDVEIPRHEPETVWFKELLESEEFKMAQGRLPFALGKDVLGQVMVPSLAKMPHLLIAGAPGGGMSVLIHAMILSLLFGSEPEDLRLVMVGPSFLELSLFEGIPQLAMPVISDPKKAVLALNWAVKEMVRRYRLLADLGVETIDDYNRKLTQGDQVKTGEPLEHRSLPAIVVIVEELADLMMVAGREAESSIGSLTRMAGPVGIHLIVATRRFSEDVLTGSIKCSFPVRIASKVFSRTDSRIILDTMGAENLLGSGDILYRSGDGAFQRVHGPIVNELVVGRVVDFIKKAVPVKYDQLTLDDISVACESLDCESGDEKWREAVALVRETRHASIAMLRRRLRIGYRRASRLMEQMEQVGIVAPSDGVGRPRKVLE